MLPLPYSQVSETKNGLNIAVNADGTITVSGTATAETYLNLNPIPASLYNRLMGVTENVIAQDYPVTTNGFTFFDLAIQPYGEIARVFIVITEGSVVNRTYRPYIIKSAEPLPYETYQGSVTPIPSRARCDVLAMSGISASRELRASMINGLCWMGRKCGREYTNENWQGAGYHVYKFYNADALISQYIASNKYPSRGAINFKGTLGVTSGTNRFYFQSSNKNRRRLKAYLAAQKAAGTPPVIIYLQSTAYDGTNGLDVCMTEYQTGFVELDGTENWVQATGANAGYLEAQVLKNTNESHLAVSSIAPFKYQFAGNCVFVTNNKVTLGVLLAELVYR